MTMPAAPSPVPQQFFDNSGAVLAGGLVTTVVAGLSTPKATYTTAALSSMNTNPITLDASGRANIFLLPGAYDFIIAKSDLTPVTTQRGIEDLTNTFLPVLGNTFATGSYGVSPGFQVTTEYFISVNSSSAGSSAAQLLLPAATRGNQLVVQNIGTSQVALIPAGSDSLNQNGATVPIVMPPATSTYTPSVILYPNGTSNWRVLDQQFLTPVQAVTAGLKINTGVVTLDGANPTPVAHGLATCTGAVVSILSSTISGAGLGLSVVTCAVSGATLNIYGFRPNNGGDTTLVASGDNTTPIAWVAFGV